MHQVRLATLGFYEGIIDHARILCLALNRQKSKLVGAVLTIPRLDKFHFWEKQGRGRRRGSLRETVARSRSWLQQRCITMQIHKSNYKSKYKSKYKYKYRYVTRVWVLGEAAARSRPSRNNNIYKHFYQGMSLQLNSLFQNPGIPKIVFNKPPPKRKRKKRKKKNYDKM